MQNTKYKQFLANKNLTQRKVAEETGTGYSNICLFANGYVRLSGKMLRRLVMYHGVSPNELLPWEEWLNEAETKKKQSKNK